MNRVSEDWIRDEIANCPPDDGGWQAKINSALSELLRARRVIETLTFHAGDKDRQCWCGTCTSLREYKAKYPNEAVERQRREREVLSGVRRDERADR